LINSILRHLFLTTAGGDGDFKLVWTQAAEDALYQPFTTLVKLAGTTAAKDKLKALAAAAPEGVSAEQVER
jgi:hypothetical protein